MSSRPPGSEVDGAGVTSGGVDVAPKLSIESGNVAMSQASRLDNRMLAEKDISFIPPIRTLRLVVFASRALAGSSRPNSTL